MNAGDRLKYLVIKKKRLVGTSESFGSIQKASTKQLDIDPRIEFESAELNPFELEDAINDPEVEDVVPSIPFSLIRPFESETNSCDENVWGIAAIGAQDCDYEIPQVTVAVLDTGIDRGHEAFQGVKLVLKDFSLDARGVVDQAVDEEGHGTHCAGTIFGRPVDGKRIGVAPGIQRALIGKVIGPEGGETEAILNAIQWALSEGADVISMSLGIDFPGLVERLESIFPARIAASRALQAYRANLRLFDSIAQMIDAYAKMGKGAVVVAASGNESLRNKDKRYTVDTAPPAAANGFLSIGAVSFDGSSFDVAPFSNTGCRLAAPGVGIVSAKLGGGLVALDGTSMATPHAAAATCLWINQRFPNGNRPKDWVRDVETELEAHSLKTSGLRRQDIGVGIVQAPQTNDD